MKYLFLLPAYILFFSSAFTQPKNTSNQFTLKGKIAGQNGLYIHLNYNNSSGKYQMDSCLVKDGEFEFSGSLESPGIAFFYGKIKSRRVDDPNSTDIFIEPVNMQVVVETDNFKKAKITGSKTQNDLAIYNERNDSFEKKWKKVFDEINDARLKNDIAKIENINNTQLPFYRTESNSLTYQFIKEFPGSFVSAYFLRYQTQTLTIDSLQLFYNLLFPSIRQSHDGKEIYRFITKAKNLETGKKAPDFSLKDIKGNSVSLQNFKGKYIFLDFWASYCVPCREENPFLTKLYSEYKNKGFTIISFSLDDANHKKEWLEAVQKDSLPWTQLCDLKGWQSEVIDQYNLLGKGIPSNFLIGTNGEILAKDLHGEDLEKKLGELIK